MEDSSDLIRNTIDSSPLFEHLSDRLRTTLATHAEHRSYQPGETVIDEGESNQDHLYLIVDGLARVWTRSPRGTVDLQTLEADQYFGEVSLLSDKVATATVEAAEDETLRVVAIARKAVLDVVEQDDDVRDQLEGVTLERARDTIGKVMD